MIKYVIVNKSDLDDVNSTIDFSVLPYVNKTRLRYNLAGDKAVIQYQTPIPSFFSGMTTYTLAQITTILDGSEWTEVLTEEDLGL
jgi:hypothetical protein